MDGDRFMDAGEPSVYQSSLLVGNISIFSKSFVRVVLSGDVCGNKVWTTDDIYYGEARRTSVSATRARAHDKGVVLKVGNSQETGGPESLGHHLKGIQYWQQGVLWFGGSPHLGGGHLHMGLE
ncbi:hypothetical protein U1Q18_010532 [Sarracenia purpurea var. burkii]